MKKRPSKDPSVEHEPHRQDGPFEGDPTEATAARNVDRGTPSDDDRVEHSVWDEPGLSQELSGTPPPDALTWAAWLERRLAKSNAWSSWTITLASAAAAGPMAVVGTFCGTFSGSTFTWFGIIAVVVTEISLITPPVGLNVFVLRGMLPDVSTATIFRGVTPFWCADIVRLAILVALPSVSLVLPHLFFK